MPTSDDLVGVVARKARIAAGLGLREAAREMSISAAYLSRVENSVDPPSADLIRKMSRLYDYPLESLIAASRKPAFNAQMRGDNVNSHENLRALYRLGIELSADDVEEFLRTILRKRFPDDEARVEQELLRLRDELPRMTESEDLLASDIKPRYLSKAVIASFAYDVLRSVGLDATTYVPPTPIDRIVDAQEGVRYSVADLPSRLVLGRTKWNVLGERLIEINSMLESPVGTNSQRFNFTLAHELFHALEHLLIAKRTNRSVGLNRIMFIEREPSPKKLSTAQRSVERWTGTRSAPRLTTNEQWREWQCNRFASCVLMPEWAVQKEFRKRIDADYLGVSSHQNVREEALQIAGEVFFGETFYESSLADFFDVSRQAMAIRLLDLELVREVEVGS
jgi:transcriptional regulator with XRE-family HTH domain